MLKKPSDSVYFLVQNVAGMMLRPESERNVLMRAYVAIQTTGVVIFLVTTFIYLLDDGPLSSKYEPLQFLISMIHITSRHLNVQYKRKFVRKFLGKLDASWKESRAQGLLHGEFVRTERKIGLFFITCFVTYMSAIPFKVAESIYKNWGEDYDKWKVPLLIWTPFPKSWYWANAVLPLYPFFCGILSITSSVCFLYTISEYIALEMKVLRHQLMTPKPTSTLSTKIFVRHQQILE